jgi:hypothetical protein
MLSSGTKVLPLRNIDFIFVVCKYVTLTLGLTGMWSGVIFEFSYETLSEELELVTVTTIGTIVFKLVIFKVHSCSF